MARAAFEAVQRARREDEELEIVFWWVGGDSQHPIEDGLDEFLETAGRRRRLWPGRRPSSGPA